MPKIPERQGLGIVPPTHPESNGHARVVDLSSYRNTRTPRQWQTFSHRVAQALLIVGLGGTAAIGALEGIRVLGEVLDSIPAEMGYSKPPSSQPNISDIRHPLRKP